MEREQEGQRVAGDLRNIGGNADIGVHCIVNANILCGGVALNSRVLICIYANNFIYFPVFYSNGK